MLFSFSFHIRNELSKTQHDHHFIFFRPGGELNTSEDQVEGLKRLLTEVRLICI